MLVLQRAVSTTVSAQSVGPSEVAAQVSLASLCPCTIAITGLQLHLQAGIARSKRDVAGMQPPFSLPPHSAQSFLFFVDHSAAAAALRAALQSCTLISDYVVPRADLAALALTALNPSGRTVTDTAAAAAPETLPGVLVDMVLHAPPAVGSLADHKSAARTGGAGVPAPAVTLHGGLRAGTAVAAVCANTHSFRLELPSFSVSRSLGAGATPAASAPTHQHPGWTECQYFQLRASPQGIGVGHATDRTRAEAPQTVVCTCSSPSATAKQHFPHTLAALDRREWQQFSGGGVGAVLSGARPT